MDVTTAVENRKAAFFSAYKIEDEATQAKIDQLFKRISAFAEDCQDYMDFETKFASSSLNQEYINLFTEIAQTHKPIIQETSSTTDTKSDAEFYAEEAVDDLRATAKSAASPARHAAYEASKEALRSNPVGNALFDLNNNLETANHLRKLFSKQSKEDNNTTKGVK